MPPTNDQPKSSRSRFLKGEKVRARAPWGVGVIVESEQRAQEVVPIGTPFPTARYPLVDFGGVTVFMSPDCLVRGHYEWVDDDG